MARGSPGGAIPLRDPHGRSTHTSPAAMRPCRCRESPSRRPDGRALAAIAPPLMEPCALQPRDARAPSPESRRRAAGAEGHRALLGEQRRREFARLPRVPSWPKADAANPLLGREVAKPSLEAAISPLLAGEASRIGRWPCHRNMEPVPVVVVGTWPRGEPCGQALPRRRVRRYSPGTTLARSCALLGPTCRGSPREDARIRRRTRRQMAGLSYVAATGRRQRRKAAGPIHLRRWQGIDRGRSGRRFPQCWENPSMDSMNREKKNDES